MEAIMFLGTDISKLPEEMKTKIMAMQAAFKRKRIAEQQIEQWKKEGLLANQAFESADIDYVDVLNRWNPDTGRLEPSLKSLPARSALKAYRKTKE